MLKFSMMIIENTNSTIRSLERAHHPARIDRQKFLTKQAKSGKELKPCLLGLNVITLPSLTFSRRLMTNVISGLCKVLAPIASTHSHGTNLGAVICYQQARKTFYILYQAPTTGLLMIFSSVFQLNFRVIIEISLTRLTQNTKSVRNPTDGARHRVGIDG